MGMIEGKVVAISGAARGMGRAHALRFAEEGADVIALDICADVETVDYPGATPADMAATVAGVEALDRRIVAAEVDVRDAEATTAAIERGVAALGGLDFLIANAGIATYCPAPEISAERWQTTIDTNLTGVWNCARAAMGQMIEAGNGGALCFTASAASYVGFPNCAHYSAAKGGLVGLMHSLAIELGPHMIRVNTLHPCSVDTPMLFNKPTFDMFVPGADLDPESPPDRERFGEVTATTLGLPIPWIESVDMANAALYLCSDMGRYVTGTELRVDAGQGVR